jgi:hypothetical protein
MSQAYTGTVLVAKACMRPLGDQSLEKTLRAGFFKKGE